MTERETWVPWALRAVVAIAMFVGGALAGGALARSGEDDISARLAQATDDLALLRTAQENLEERNWTLYLENTALREELQSLTGTPPTTSTGERTDGTTFGDGIWLVGRDIEPGTYDGTVTRESGYWARLKNTTGMVNAIVVNGVPRGPFVLTINPSDEAVELRGVVLTAR